MDVEYELSAKRVELNVLEAELDAAELWECGEYRRLRQRISALEKQVEGKGSNPEATRSEPLVFEAEMQE